jgi:hypothetical protein
MSGNPVVELVPGGRRRGPQESEHVSELMSDDHRQVTETAGVLAWRIPADADVCWRMGFLVRVHTTHEAGGRVKAGGHCAMLVVPQGTTESLPA